MIFFSYFSAKFHKTIQAWNAKDMQARSTHCVSAFEEWVITEYTLLLRYSFGGQIHAEQGQEHHHGQESTMFLIALSVLIFH